MPKRYQGEDIEYSLTIMTSETLSDMARIVVYLYTHQSNVVKFEWKAQGQTTTGYTAMTVDSQAPTKKLIATLTAANTKLMEGSLLCNVYCQRTGKAALQSICAADTGIRIMCNLVKTESV